MSGSKTTSGERRRTVRMIDAMRRRIWRQAEIRCDVCGARHRKRSRRVVNELEFVSRLLGGGWTNRNGEIVCDICVRNRTRVKWREAWRRTDQIREEVLRDAKANEAAAIGERQELADQQEPGDDDS